MRYLFRRLAQALALLVVVIALTFVLIHAAPGDPIYALAGEAGDAAYYAQMRAHHGLDRPVVEQLGLYLLNTLRGDLGHSYIQRQPVLSVIASRVPATLLLLTTALTLATAAGIHLGVAAARNTGRFVDGAIRVATLLGQATPAFWLGQIMLLVFAAGLGWFPTQGMVNARGGGEGLAHVLDIAAHLVLPATTLGLLQLALVTRLTRAGVLEALTQDYVRTARAKGVAETRVLHRHALRNALLPVVTAVGGQVGTLLTGAVLTEMVFAWPGLGRLLYDATLTRDYPLLLGIFQVTTTAVIVANLVVDLLYARLDPRVRLQT